MTYEIIKKETLTEVQEYNYFYEDFGKILKQIISAKQPDDEIILNISSGSPAMKSALLVLQHLWESDCKLVQVSTPTKSINDPKAKEFFCIKTHWNKNLDNNDDKREITDTPDELYQKVQNSCTEKIWLKEFYDYESDQMENSTLSVITQVDRLDESYMPVNRCEEVRCTNLIQIKNQEMVKNLIDAYDYNAALQIVSSMKGKNSIYESLIRLAKHRLLLDTKEVDKIFNALPSKHKSPCFIPYTEEKSRDYYEFVQMLEVKYKTGHYGDFVRALTPIIFDCFLLIIKNQLNIDVYVDLCDYNKYQNSYKWSQTKMQNNSNPTVIAINQILNNETNKVYNKYLYSSNFVDIINELVTDEKIKENISFLRKVETALRNIAAHQIISITKKNISEKLFWNGRKRDGAFILEQIKLALKFGGYDLFEAKAGKDGSYEKMNQKIKAVIDEQS